MKKGVEVEFRDGTYCFYEDVTYVRWGGVAILLDCEWTETETTESHKTRFFSRKVITKKSEKEVKMSKSIVSLATDLVGSIEFMEK